MVCLDLGVRKAPIGMWKIVFRFHECDLEGSFQVCELVPMRDTFDTENLCAQEYRMSSGSFFFQLLQLQNPNLGFPLYSPVFVSWKSLDLVGSG